MPCDPNKQEYETNFQKLKYSWISKVIYQKMFTNLSSKYWQSMKFSRVNKSLHNNKCKD